MGTLLCLKRVKSQGVVGQIGNERLQLNKRPFSYHTYNLKTANSVYEQAVPFARDARLLLNQLRSRND